MRYDTALAVRSQGWSTPAVNSGIEWIERNQSMIAIQGACGSLASLNVIGIRQCGREAGKRLGCHSGAVFSFKQYVGYGLRHVFRPDFLTGGNTSACRLVQKKCGKAGRINCL